jgi:hypothetical protein
MDGVFWKLNVVNVAFTTIANETADIVKQNASPWNLFVLTLSWLVTRILSNHVTPLIVDVSYNLSLYCVVYLTIHRYILAKFDIFECVTYTTVKKLVKTLLCVALPVVVLYRIF